MSSPSAGMYLSGWAGSGSARTRSERGKEHWSLRDDGDQERERGTIETLVFLMPASGDVGEYFEVLTESYDHSDQRRDRYQS